MNPILDDQIISNLSGSYLAVDTCCLIDATKNYGVIGKFLVDLINQGVGFYTVPIVVYEFLRGAGTMSDLKERNKILETITDNTVLAIDKHFEKMTDFLVIMNRNSKCDLGEYQLIASILGYKNRYVLTENHKHMPTEFLDRETVITFNLKDEIKNYGLYKFNSSKYEKIAQNILSLN